MSETNFGRLLRAGALRPESVSGHLGQTRKQRDDE